MRTLSFVVGIVASSALAARGDEFFTLDSLLSSAPVSLTNATATFEQNGTTLSVGTAIDGDAATDGAGWAIGGGQSVNQHAVFQTTGPLSVGPAGSELTFTLTNNFSSATHVLGNLRISATTAANPTAASAAGIWTELVPLTATASSGVNLLTTLDNRVQYDPANVTNPGQDVYTVTANVDTSLEGITGFRLETIADGSLMSVTNAVGPGLTSNNGNFVLTEFAVDAVQFPPPPLTPEPATGALMVLSLATFAGASFWRRRRLRAL